MNGGSQGPRPRGRATERPQPRPGALALLLLAAVGAANPPAAAEPPIGITQLSRGTWSGSSGLPDGEIRALVQTRDGYIWAGSYTGIARFDGVQFTVFRSPQNPGLTAIPIEGLAEAPDGSLWIASPGGLSRYRNGAFTRFGSEQGLRHPYGRAVLAEPDGSVLVCTGGSGVWRLDVEAARFRQLPPFERTDVPQFVEDIRRDRQGRLWAATTEGVLRLGEGDSYRRFTRADGLGSDRTSLVFVDRAGTLWAGTTGGLSRLDGERFRTLGVRDGLPDNDVTALAEDRHGRLWIGTRGGGLACLQGGTLTRLASPGSSAAGVFSLLEDRQGGLWIGTDGGLDRLHEGALRTFGRSEGLENEEMLGVLAARDGTVYYVDGRGAVGRLVGSRVEPVLPPGSASGIAPSLGESRAGIWVAGRELRRVDLARPEPLPPGVFEPSALRADADGLLFAAHVAANAFGIFRLDANGVRRLHPEVTVASVHVHDLIRDRSGSIWLATEGAGVQRLGPQRRTFGTRDGLPHETSYSLFEDEDGSIWVSTRVGLARIEGERVRAAPRPNALPSEGLIRFVPDRARNLWLATDAGVLRQSLAELAASLDQATPAPGRLYGSADGLRSVAVSWRPSALSAAPDGRVWFATTRGLAVLDPSAVGARGAPLSVYVERVFADGRAVSGGAALRLPAGVSRLDFQFTGLDFDRPQGLRFRHHLQGYDTGWVDAGTRRQTQYTGVPPGRYTFRVVACGEDALSCDEPGAAVALVLPSLWYQTGAFRAALAGLGVLLLLGTYSLRVGALRRREAELARLVEERTRELRRQADEREQVEEALRRLTSTLEDRIRNRTEELERTNAQLAEDITARAQAEQALSAEKERLAVTLRSLADGVVATTIDGSITLFNRAAEAMSGWTATAALGQPLATVVRLLDRDTRAPVRADSAISSRPAEDVPRLLLARDGRELSVSTSAATIHGRDSAPLGIVLVLRDVTDKLRLEEHLQKQEKLDALGVLAGGIAHDFNNLLTGIFGFLEIARLRAGVGSLAGAPLDSASSVLERARGLTQQLLTFARGGEPVTRPTSLQELLASCMRFALSGSSLRSELNVAEDLWHCEIDERLIDQAFDNILINARQATPAGGSVVVDAANVELPDTVASSLLPGRYVSVTVRDQGAGIPHEALGRVFDPFFTTKATGTGLGLATTHSIIKRHRGLIEIQSEPGAGTTVRVLLPAANAAPAAVAGETAAGTVAAGRVLVMDDEECVREVAREALECIGYEVEVAASGTAALALHAAACESGRRFDVVVLDLTIPGDLGGVAVLELLKRHDPGVRAIASSGYSSDAVMAAPATFGFRAAVTKPYTLAELEQAVVRAQRS